MVFIELMLFNVPLIVIDINKRDRYLYIVSGIRSGWNHSTKNISRIFQESDGIGFVIAD